ncbi:hypothetical protein OKW43_005675 [Paraburkholderia sp. WC7.3g]|uniref:hypothetical protein n=1 Tax=Paraburkholderia sp. WC7.3g TaxID=2991070 RepID=UPI003D235838
MNKFCVVVIGDFYQTNRLTKSLSALSLARSSTMWCGLRLGGGLMGALATALIDAAILLSVPRVFSGSRRFAVEPLTLKNVPERCRS